MITVRMRRDSENENYLWAMHDEARMELVHHAAQEHLLSALLTETGHEATLTITVDLEETGIPSEEDPFSPERCGMRGRPPAERLELFVRDLQDEGLLSAREIGSLRFEADTFEEGVFLTHLTLLLRDAYSPPTARH